MAGIRIIDVNKVYPNGYQAIEGISIDITDGEFIVLVGPSGCGKSTLLRMVAGLETISAGEIYINERLVNNIEPAQRDIAMVFQNYALYPHMSVFNNMAYGLKNQGIAKTQIQKRVTEIAQLLGLEKLLEQRPRELSGGQRQRVAMGRAIVRQPTAFLFDEPLSNLDAKLRVQMRLEIKRLQRELKTTSIYVTHDQVEAMTMADRLVVINKGRAEQIGTPLELYERPQTRFVADFIGSPSMNFISGSVTADGLLSLANGQKLNVDTNISAVDTPIIVGIRPEHLRLAESGNLRMTVEMTEMLGAETLIHGKLDHTDESISAKVDGTELLEPGDIVTMSLSSNSLHLFSPDNGKRLN